MSAIVSLTSQAIRSNRRGTSRDVSKIEPELQLIIDAFVSSIFLYPSHVSYDEIYEYYHDKWKKQIDKFSRSKIKTIAIDSNFFEYNYKSKIK